MSILILWVSGIQPLSAEQARETAFAEIEKWFIGAYLENMEEEGGRGKDGAPGPGKDEGRGMAQGRAAAAEGLRRNATLPSGLEVSELPRELESQLPPLPEGLERVLVGGRVALVEKASRRIQDVFEPREARENGPPADFAVCHVPPGNPSRRKTLSLPEPAIRSHLGHGDYIGRCR